MQRVYENLGKFILRLLLEKRVSSVSLDINGDTVSLNFSSRDPSFRFSINEPLLLFNTDDMAPVELKIMMKYGIR